MNKIVIFALMLLVLTVGVIVVTNQERNIFPYSSRDTFLPEIYVGGTHIKVLVADTTEEHMRGLSGNDPLNLNQGMLFIFQSEGIKKIWMKDMKFGLDIYWINTEKVILHIEKNIYPETYPKVFGPDHPVKYVLEVPAGFSEIFNINVGDTIKF
jgi:uncharacterized protein